MQVADVALPRAGSVTTQAGTRKSFCKGNSIFLSADLSWQSDDLTRHSFISFMAVVQTLKIDILPITWQPALDDIGKGATARVLQSFVNLEISFAFKRPMLEGLPSLDEKEFYRTLVSEIFILSQPSIRGHPSITRLEGVCWDVHPQAMKVHPVLVFEKAPLGDLAHFLTSEEGRSLNGRSRLNLCMDIAQAIGTLHSANVIHGDVKPENILVFRNVNSHYIAKVSDFGYSTFGAGDGDLVYLPRSPPWHAPELHHRGISPEAARRADVYSYGLVCFWIMFLPRLLVPTEQTQNLLSYPYTSYARIEEIKRNGNLLRLAQMWIEGSVHLDIEQKNMILQAMTQTLIDNPDKRLSDVEILLHHFNPKRIVPATGPGIRLERQMMPHAHFDISKQFLQLVMAHYDLRKHIVENLTREAEEDQSASNQMVSAFQLAICFRLGFGVPKSGQSSRCWLEKSKKTPADLATAIEDLEHITGLHYENARVSELFSNGHINMIDYTQEYRKLESLDTIEGHHEREISDFKSVLGPNHLAVLKLRDTLTSILQSQGKFEAAIDQGQRALEGYQLNLGHDNKETWTSTSDLAYIYMLYGEYDQAELLGRNALEKRESHLGPLHAHTLTSLNRLAVILQQRGKLEEAEGLSRREMEGRERIFGETHLETLDSIANLGSILQDLGRLDDAVDMNRRALKGRERALGPEHPQTLVSICNLAQALQEQDRFEEAEILIRRDLEVSTRVLGPEHYETVTSMSNLAQLLSDQHKYSEAEHLFQEAYGISKKTLGSRHPETLTSMANISHILHQQERFEEALPIDREVLKLREEELGLENLDTILSVSNLARTLDSLEFYDEARSLTSRALAARERLLGVDHPMTLESVFNMSLLLHNVGDLDAAESMSRRALGGRLTRLGASHQDTERSLVALVDLLQAQDRDEEAEAAYGEYAKYTENPEEFLDSDVSSSDDEDPME